MDLSDNKNQSKEKMIGVEVKTALIEDFSGGLFDYKFDKNILQLFRFSRSMNIGQNTRKKIKSIACWKNDEDLESQNGIQRVEPLLRVKRVDPRFNKYEVDLYNQNCQSKNQKISSCDIQTKYLVVKSLKMRDGITQRGCPLRPGDVFRLGFLDIMVMEMKVWNRHGTNLVDVLPRKNNKIEMSQEFLNNFTDVTYQAIQNEKDNEEVCLICMERSSYSDPIQDILVILCICKGTGKKRHIGCIKEWLKTKMESSQNDRASTYNFNKVGCEICRSKWPMNIKYKHKMASLLEVEQPKVPYMKVEWIYEDGKKKKHTGMSFLLGKLNKNISLGRKDSNHLRLDFDFISKSHSQIKFKNNKFYLFDNDSRFGTLIKLVGPMQIAFEKATIQIGTMIASFKLKQLDLSSNYLDKINKIQTNSVKNVRDSNNQPKANLNKRQHDKAFKYDNERTRNSYNQSLSK